MLVISIISVVLLVLIWKWYLKRKDYHSKIALLPGPKPDFLIGNLKLVVLLALSKNLNHPHRVLGFQIFMGLNKIHEGTGFYVIWMCSKPVLNIFHPKLCEIVLNSNTSLEKSFEYTFLHSWLGLGLLTSTGSKWRSRRKLLTPSFHFRILEDFLPVFNEQSLAFINIVKSLPEKDQPVDVMPRMALLTLDVICETVMGVPIHAQQGKNLGYVKCVHDLCVAFYDRIVSPWLWPDILFSLTKRGKAYQENLNTVHSFTKQVIREKKSSKEQSPKVEEQSNEEVQVKKRKALMDLLLDLHLDGDQIKEEDIQEEVDTFMLGGHDTVSLGLTYTLYCIGLYPDVQRKIVDELDGIFEGDRDRPVTMDDIRDMKYLECVVKETLRLYPSVPVIGRKLEEDIHFEGYYIPKGLTLHISMMALHRNPNNFPNPEVFDPDRFSPENAHGRHPYAFLPFSAGPRNCIGQKFAFLEEKAIISNILRHFEIESVDQRDQVQICFEFTLKPTTPIRLKFIPRR